MTFTKKPGPFSAAMGGAIVGLNQRTQASTRRRREHTRNVALAVAARRKSAQREFLDLLGAHSPSALSELLALQQQAQNTAVRSAKWQQAVESFKVRHGAVLGEVRGRFSGLENHFGSQLLLPPMVRYAKGPVAPGSSAPAKSTGFPTAARPGKQTNPQDATQATGGQSLIQKTVVYDAPGWNAVAVGDPPYEYDQNLIECDAFSGYVHIKAHSRLLVDTFGLSNTAGIGVYVNVDPGYRQADIAVEYEYTGEVDVITTLGEAAASVDLIYDLSDVAGAQVDHFESTLRGLVNFPNPFHPSQYSDFSSTNVQIATTSVSIDTNRYPNGMPYLVSLQYRCTVQSFGGSEADAFVRGTLRRVTVTMRP